APLKLHVAGERHGVDVRFPRSMTAAPLKRGRRRPLCLQVCGFPRSMTAAPLKRSPNSMTRPLPFALSAVDDRGPIEAWWAAERPSAQQQLSAVDDRGPIEARWYQARPRCYPDAFRGR